MDESSVTGTNSPGRPGIEPTQAGEHEEASASVDVPLRCGQTIARYVVLDRLGRGGMGVVYAAYDPKLDRRIAVKVLHGAHGDEAGRRRSQRLLREAQAMAQLSHPNVIAVHDVGTADGRVFLAMELVEGCTLKQWLRQRPRSWSEVLEVFVAAGRGLQAAHAAGLVHRDFKPDNVLVGSDGRVRVTDFGIARPPRTGSSAGLSISALQEALEGTTSSGSDGRVLDMTLTRPGAVPGTPAYMSPEQFGRGSLDARGDQFSYCVALWEALYGESPFEGYTATERAMAVARGELRSPPSDRQVPPFVHAVLVRGLAVRPEQRYPTMAAVLADLERRPSRTRLPWLAAGAVVAVGLATLVAGGVRRDPCVDAGSDMAGTWNDESRSAVESAMLGTELPFAADTWSRVRPKLDAYAETWVAGRISACRASHGEGEAHSLPTERMIRCLNDQRARLEALVDVLAVADAVTVERASAAVAGLPRVDACSDPQALLEVSIEPESTERAALGERYLEGLALDAAGRFEEGLRLVEELRRDVEAFGDPGLMVAVLSLHGGLLTHTDPAEGEQVLRRAYFEAVRHHEDGVAARVATTLVYVTGSMLARVDEALEWSQHADAAIDRAGGEPHLRIKLLRSLGDSYLRKGELEQAYEYHERAWALLVQHRDAYDESRGDEWGLLSSMGAVRLEQGNVEQAEQGFQRALVLAEEELGPRHPEVARVHNELGNLAYRQERADEARRRYELALELWESAVRRGPSVITMRTNLGNLADTEGRFEEARTHYERALEDAEQLFGPDHVNTSFVLVNLGIMHEHAGEPVLAVERHRRALALREAAFGPEELPLVNPLMGLARAELERGDPLAARQHAERAVAIRRAKGAGDPDGTALALAPLGVALVRIGEVESGRARLQEALDACEGDRCATRAPLGLARLELAGLLPPDDEQRAALLRRARDELVRAGVEGARTLARLDAMASSASDDTSPR
ncbi:serine/threonine-protein kinase [Paraliomyxa miuraensis]|uniref:serine/threonine-protein kinase n=1 Tax=Paraliomyxa miuraensis TaxID=376150 RepID=UPI002250396E|nr:serine/threonine-protein kinase [Paraliomyxa miuraensis]MCX4239887.1 serine/threonine-protein kinase [Paraliomyxa miuraensis]